MGYFSNGTEGADFEEQFCKRCVHYGPEEGPGCPVWLAHLLYNYEECNSDSNAKSILDMLIERDTITSNRCTMFVEVQDGR
jgi:hypothetical protein